MRQSPSQTAAEIRGILKRDGSAKHAKGVRWFFKEEIKSHGWYAADLRTFARSFRRKVIEERGKEEGVQFLMQVADRLFTGRVLEEKVFAVLLLEGWTAKFGDEEFAMFELWLDRISSWADHDALVHSLMAPMIASEPSRVARVFRWAKSSERWHRRAACVALIQGRRQKEFFPLIIRLSNSLLRDKDDMVQKGLGWLLRVTAKQAPAKTVSYLLKIRGKAPRLVLRTACETLSASDKRRVLAKQVQ